MTNPGPSVAILGLGIMGSAFARNLLKRGFSVQGFDPSAHAAEQSRRAGVSVAAAAPEAIKTCDVVLTSLPSEAALEATVDALVDAKSDINRNTVIAELSTLSLDGKQAARERLEAAGAVMLDCPVSGTGAQAAARDIVLYASGAESAYGRCHGVFDAIARDSVFLGAFGNGMRMKLIANLLVAIHNVASAEALALGKAAGLDPQQVYDVISSGAGTSRIFELRGPMMAKEIFEPATMKLDVWQKDMALIEAFAAEAKAETPLFDTTKPLYDQALQMGLGSMDTAAVFQALTRGKAAD